MGFYIPGPALGKAEYITGVHGGEIISTPPATLADLPDGKALIVVVTCPTFEAAGFAYDQHEFEAFTRPDTRRKTFIIMNRDKAEVLSGYHPRTLCH